MPGIPGLPGLREVRSAVSRTPAVARGVWSRARASATFVTRQAGRVGGVLPGAGGRPAAEPAERKPAGRAGAGRTGRTTPARGRSPAAGAARPVKPAAGSARAGGGSRRGGRVGVADTGRQELYAMARDLGIAGRSRMSKRELAEAVRRATGGAVGGSSAARSRRSSSTSPAKPSGTSSRRGRRSPGA